jgi:hypothetical protein
MSGPISSVYNIEFIDLHHLPPAPSGEFSAAVEEGKPLITAPYADRGRVANQSARHCIINNPYFLALQWLVRQDAEGLYTLSNFIFPGDIPQPGWSYKENAAGEPILYKPSLSKFIIEPTEYDTIY